MKLPRIKTKREDVLRRAEVLQMLQDAEKGECLYRYKDRSGQRKSLLIRFDLEMIQCLIALLWLFGKRITEILRLKRKDVWAKYGDVWKERGYLFVRFTILKKEAKNKQPIPVKKVKRIRISNNLEFVKPIARYVGKIKDPEAYLFPGNSRPHKLIAKRKDKETGRIIKVYKYEVTDRGLMSREHAYKILKGLNPKCWIHLFRHSLATQLAEEGFSGIELMHWFDWSRYETALRYVAGSPKLTEKISKRTF